MLKVIGKPRAPYLALRLREALTLASLIAASAAHATDLPEQHHHRNANGGAPFRVTCAPGSYLTGFSGKAGAWIDNMTIVCAPWLEGERRLMEAVVLEDHMVGRSDGGEATSSTCPAGWVISGPYRPTFSWWDDSGLVHSIEFNCTPPEIESDSRIPRAFGSASSVDPSANDYIGKLPQAPDACPPEEFATGIHGRSGLFVDAVGLICGVAPTQVLCAAGLLICGAPADKPAPPAPMVEIRRNPNVGVIP
jgi:hypothetical protein